MTVRAVPAAAALAVLCAVLLLVLPAGAWVLRAPPAVLIVAALPGYTVLAALRPAAGLGPAERGALAIALSLVITIVLSLAAALAGIPLGTTLWALGGAGAAVCGAAIAGNGSNRRLVRLGIPAARPATILFVLVTLALLAGAAAIGTQPQPLPRDVRGTVALWILPAGDHAATLGVQNEQRTALAYVVRVSSGAQKVVTRRTPVLAPGGRWRATVALPPGVTTIEATLTTVSDPSRELRRVRLTPGASVPIDKGAATR